MNAKQFLQLGGTLFVLVGILGFIGVIGPTATESVFGSFWWFDNVENWTHLVLGIVALAASFVLPRSAHKPLVLLVGLFAIVVAVWGFINPMLLGANLENPADAILHLGIGAWALWAGLRRQKMI